MKPTVSIVILNYNTKDLLRQTLESVDSLIPYEIIVVDNASTDDSVAMLKKDFKNVKVIAQKTNNGFSAGNNVGVRQAVGEYIMLLNSDTEFVGEVLTPLVELMQQKKEVGVVTPKLIFPDGKLDPGSHRGLPSVWNSLTYFMGLEKRFPQTRLFGGYHQSWKDLDQIHQVDVVSGASMLIRKKVWQQVGELDERFFMYAEDIDYCLRVKQAGWQVYYNPRSKVIHHKGQSGIKNANQKLSSKTRKYFYQTMKQYWDKHYSNSYPKIVTWFVHRGVDVVERVRS